MTPGIGWTRRPFNEASATFPSMMNLAPERCPRAEDRQGDGETQIAEDCFPEARALDPQRRLTQYVLDNWRTKDGLAETLQACELRLSGSKS